MGNTKILNRRKKNINSLGFGMDVDSPIAVPLLDGLNLVKGNTGISIFDGVNDYVAIPDVSIGKATTFSFETNVKIGTTTTTNYEAILHYSNASDDRIGLVIYNNNLRVGIYNGISYFVKASAPVSDNTEYNIKVNYNGTDAFELYLDDVQKTGTDSPGLSASGRGIGGNGDSDRQFHGEVYDFTLYSDDSYTTKLFEYDLKNSATYGKDGVLDLSGNGNHGTSYGKVDFTRTTTATYKDGNGIIRTASIDEPRFEGVGVSLSSAGNDGTCFGGVSIEDGAMKFDGVDDYVSNSNIIFDTNSNLTISFWGKAYNSGDNTFRRLFEYGNRGIAVFVVGSGTGLIKYSFGVYDSVSTSSELRTSYIAENTWQYLTLTKTGDNYIAYLNGVNLGSFSASTRIQNDILFLGRENGGNYLNGSIRDVIIYDRALSTTEISNLYNDIRITDGLIAEYTGEYYEGLQSAPTKIIDTANADFSIDFQGDGYLSEEQSVNLFLNSTVPVTQNITVTDATIYTLNVKGTGSIALSGGGAGTATEGSPVTFTSTTTTVTCTVTGSLDYVNFEQKSFPTSYIVTAGTSVTRTADSLSYDVSDIVTQGQGSIYCEFECLGTGPFVSSFPYILELNDGTADNRISFMSRGESNYIRSRIINSSSIVCDIISSNNLLTFNTLHKIMITYEDNNAKLYFNGVKIGEDTSCIIPTTLNDIKIGCSYDDDDQLNGNIKSVKYFKQVLSEATAINLTK